MSTVFSTEQQAKLKNLINEGLGVMTEVETLQGGLKDTVKAVAEELSSSLEESEDVSESSTRSGRSEKSCREEDRGTRIVAVEVAYR